MHKQFSSQNVFLPITLIIAILSAGLSQVATCEELEDFLINGTFFDYEVKIGTRTFPDAAYADFFDGVLAIEGTPENRWFYIEMTEGELGLELSYEENTEDIYTTDDFYSIYHYDQYSPGFVIAPDPFFDGQGGFTIGTYSGSYQNDRLDLWLDYDNGVSSGNVNITTTNISVPYGSFDCYRIRYSGNYSVPGKSGSHTITMYLVRGLGLIRYDYVARDMNYSLRLTDVSLGPYVPKQPEILSPDQGETVSVTPLLTSSAYRILEGGGIHISSLWQISDTATHSVAWSLVDDDEDLLSEALPSGALDYDTEYSVQVNHQSADFQESEWSEPVIFRTETTQHEVVFDPAPHGTQVGGGPLVQYIWHRDAAVAPQIRSDSGWVFNGWSPALPASITAPWSGTAVYADVAAPEIQSDPREIVLTQNDPLPNLREGITALDNGDGDISGQVTVNGSPDMSQPGTYPVAYEVTDSSGNASLQIVRLYHVVPPSSAWMMQVMDGAPTRAGDILTLGTHADASNGLDGGLDVVSVPSPGGAWIRLLDPESGTELSADYRSIGPESNFILAVQAGAGSPLTLTWSAPGLPDGMYASLWEISVSQTRETLIGEPIGNTFLDMARTGGLAVAAGELRHFAIRVSYDHTVDCRLRKGWNLIHLPVAPNFKDSSLVFPEWVADSATGQVFSFWLWREANLRSETGSLAANQVYWIYSPAAGVYLVRGLPTGLTSWELHAGWNVLGAPYPMDSLPDMGELDGPVWGYDNPSGQFYPAGTTTSQSAIWVNAPSQSSIPLP